MKVTILATAAVALALAPQIASAQSGDVVITTAQHDEYGAYITDSEGRALYMFEIDEQGGQGGAEAVSKCSGECADAWPPLIVEGEPQLGEGVSAELVGTFEREDGEIQVTYGGWPLYYFVRDEGPGDVQGHDVDGFGGEWYLLTPEGEEAPH